MTIFITGGSGFVGLNLIEQLLTRGDSVVSFSLT
ncbi:MAG: NAD(P)-dependent oxidoreductase, partial [Lysobacterales bacterium]